MRIMCVFQLREVSKCRPIYFMVHVQYAASPSIITRGSSSQFTGLLASIITDVLCVLSFSKLVLYQCVTVRRLWLVFSIDNVGVLP